MFSNFFQAGEWTNTARNSGGSVYMKKPCSQHYYTNWYQFEYLTKVMHKLFCNLNEFVCWLCSYDLSTTRLLPPSVLTGLIAMFDDCSTIFVSFYFCCWFAVNVHGKVSHRTDTGTHILQQYMKLNKLNNENVNTCFILVTLWVINIQVLYNWLTSSVMMMIMIEAGFVVSTGARTIVAVDSPRVVRALQISQTRELWKFPPLQRTSSSSNV